MTENKLQRMRLIVRSLFFLLFLLAPVLNVFRFDLTTTNFIVFNQVLSFGMTTEWILASDHWDAGLRILGYFILPIILTVAIGIYIFYKWGRLYCGWLCPHFSVVEYVNDLMDRRTGRVTIWEKAREGKRGKVIDWVIIVAISMTIAFLWALGLLSYLLPPIPLYTNLMNFEMGLYPTIFLIVATVVFTIDFVLARHLFCKYGCAFGVMQSLFWMMNSKAMLVKFDRDRAKACQSCDKNCETACPMRLPVRSFKRAKFTCTQCAQCISACQEVQKDNPEGTLLDWSEGETSRHSSLIPVKTIEVKKMHNESKKS
ncbi:Iron-sulfur cluster-binding protein [Oleispira antarctica RB-8]|uniref:Iron-sulfur cluster-binding protein n=1 Tax=Oleispira antarctica RB-8 TaxID=698738 RepID=R4YNE3_OLEAN|nr:Iron-sulfur cluster-binding protein [Oleispira antarctica RB-8]